MSTAGKTKDKNLAGNHMKLKDNGDTLMVNHGSTAYYFKRQV